MSHNPITGSFTIHDNQLSVLPTGAQHPIERSHLQMVGELARLVPPRIRLNPLPEEFEDVADYLLRLAGVIDRHFKAIGEEVASNATTKIALVYFENVLREALDGWATNECDRAAEALREEQEWERRA